MPKIVVRPAETDSNYIIKGSLVRETFTLARNAEGNIYLKRRR